MGRGMFLALAVVFSGCIPSAPRHGTLMEAVEAGDLTDIRRHLRQGVPVDETGVEGWTALMVAAYRGDVRVLRLLLDHGADPGVRNRAGASPLMVAVRHGHYHAVRCLLDRGAEAQARTEAGLTPLMLAVRKGDIRIVQVLLEHGAEVADASGEDSAIWRELARLEQRTGFRRPDVRNLLAQGLPGKNEEGYAQ